MPASIERLSANRDLNGMVRALRSRSDPQRREDAVHALGRWGDSDVYPWLLKAVLYDDDALVRQAARQVLREHLGAALDLALQVESSGQPEEQPWLVEEEGEDGTGGEDGVDEEEGLSAQEAEELRGLILVAREEPNPTVRIRAIQALGKISNLHAIRTLASLALHEADDRVQRAAYDALEGTFGEDLPAFLASLEDETELEADEDADAEPLRMDPADYYAEPSNRWDSPAGVVNEEKAHTVMWVLIGVSLLVVVFLLIVGLGG